MHSDQGGDRDRDSVTQVSLHTADRLNNNNNSNNNNNNNNDDNNNININNNNTRHLDNNNRNRNQDSVGETRTASLSPQSTAASRITPRRVHPALFPRDMADIDGQQTIRGPRQSVFPRVESSSFQTAQTDSGTSSTQTPKKERSDRSLRRSPDTNHSTSDKGGSARAKSSAKRARMRMRRASVDRSEDDTSESNNDDFKQQDRRFEKAFMKFDPNDEGHISMSDFLQFFDTLQGYLPPLSETLLDATSRHTALEYMGQTDGQLPITRDELKTFYTSITGKSLVEQAKQSIRIQQDSDGEDQRGKAEKIIRRPERIDVTPRTDQAPPLSPVSPTTQARRNGNYFAKPRPPRRATSSAASPSASDSEGGVTRSMADILNDSSLDFTGGPLATSTPTQRIRRDQRRAISPELQSPTKDDHDSSYYPNGPNFGLDAHPRHPSASTESNWGYQSGDGSPTPNRGDLDVARDLLHREQEARTKVETDLQDLQRTADEKQRRADEELALANEEVERLSIEIDSKRKEIEHWKSNADNHNATASVFSDQLQAAKEDLERLSYKNMVDREQISVLNSDIARVSQQKAEADHQVDALTADLRKVMADRDQALAEKDSALKRSSMVSELRRQLHSSEEKMKDRDVMIERLNVENERRQLDLETMANNARLSDSPGKNGGRGTKNRINTKLALLSDELNDASATDSGEDDEEEEDEEIVTTVKRTTRKKKRMITQGNASIGSPLTDEFIEQTTKVDRAIQTSMSMSEVDDHGRSKIPQVHEISVQTSVAIDVSQSLEDHFLKDLPEGINVADKDLLKQIAKAKAKSQTGDLSSPDLEELFSQIGLQSELIQRMQQTKARPTSREAYSPRSGIDYTCLWVQQWLALQYTLLTYRLPWASVKQRMLLDTAESDFAKLYPRPQAISLILLGLLIVTFTIMMIVTARFASAVHRNENMWLRANKLSSDYTGRHSFLEHLGAGRALDWLKYEAHKRLAVNRRMPI